MGQEQRIMNEWSERVALITGAGGNLGRALSSALAAVGARLALFDRDDAVLAAARAQLPAASAVELYALDLVDPSAVAAAVARTRAHFGRIDILANIAGGFVMGPPLHETPDADWDLMLDINARTVFNLCRAVVPTLLAQGEGRIINVAARAGLEGKAQMAPYCVAKAAVIVLTESLADELRDHNIRVNCVLPSILDTPQNRAAMPDADFSRWVSPAAVAEVMMFLCSDAARAITGAAVPVYGRS